jgi:hypothetical protein
MPDGQRFNNTVTARWRSKLVGPKAAEKSHWRTKTAYYRAVNELHTTGTGHRLSWRSIVCAVQPRGSRSTFYDVTGPHAKHALIDAFLDTDGGDSTQLALCFRRHNAVDQLIDEAKVWSYWPYREGWLKQCRSASDLGEVALADALVSVVAEWARCNPQLAAALDYSPPPCAVEDLMLLRPGQLPAVRACSTLAKAMRGAISSTDLADGVVETFRADLGLAHSPASTPDSLLVGLAEQIYAMSRESQRLSPTDASAVHHLATKLMLDAVAAMA